MFNIISSAYHFRLRDRVDHTMVARRDRRSVYMDRRDLYRRRLLNNLAQRYRDRPRRLEYPERDVKLGEKSVRTDLRNGPGSITTSSTELTPSTWAGSIVAGIQALIGSIISLKGKSDWVLSYLPVAPVLGSLLSPSIGHLLIL